MEFHIVFSKSDFCGEDSFFDDFFLLKKPKTPEYAKVLVVTCPKLNSVTDLLFLPPNMKLGYFKIK